LNEKGEYASIEEIKIALMNGMFHDKIGIFTDSEQNKIGFVGSLNETPSAYLNHGESIHTSKSWQLYPGELENEHLKNIINRFENLWENRQKRIKVYKLPDDKLSKITKYAPKNSVDYDYVIQIDELYRNIESNLDKNNMIFDKEGWVLKKNSPLREIESLELRTCQLNAIEELKKNDFQGILQMATGSGKTIAAISASYFLYTKYQKILTIIAVPDNFLVEQWSNVIKNFTHKYLTASSNYNWKSKFKEKIISFRFSKIFNYYIICTKEAIKDIIVDFIQRINPEIQKSILYIADEVHWMGAKTAIRDLSLFDPKFRIGLSATPQRYFDSEGTDFLLEWFKKGIIYEYSLKDGQNDGYLNLFNYYTVFSTLNEEEFEEYQKLTTDIIRLMNQKKSESEDVNLENLLIKRARILKKASSKRSTFIDLIKKLKNQNSLKNCVVYFEDNEQLDEYRLILKDLSIKSEKFTGDTDKEQRNLILNKFVNNEFDVLCAIRCLDQGVDIPCLEIAIIISSTGSEREWIQRVGRLLRKSEGKRIFAEIYDFIVLEQGQYNISESILEQDKIFLIQKSRVSFLLDTAENKYQELARWNNYPDKIY
jgi:superfamily II DNA or RNA helicase